MYFVLFGQCFRDRDSEKNWWQFQQQRNICTSRELNNTYKRSANYIRRSFDSFQNCPSVVNRRKVWKLGTRTDKMIADRVPPSYHESHKSLMLIKFLELVIVKLASMFIIDVVFYYYFPPIAADFVLFVRFLSLLQLWHGRRGHMFHCNRNILRLHFDPSVDIHKYAWIDAQQFRLERSILYSFLWMFQVNWSNRKCRSDSTCSTVPWAVCCSSFPACSSLRNGSTHSERKHAIWHCWRAPYRS